MINAMTTMSDSRPGPAKGPGRPRSERAHEAILEATLDLLLEEGFTRMSIEAVATRAGVGKATIYRRWPSKADLVVEAVACRKEQPFVDPDSGGVREDLVSLARQAFRPSESSEVTELVLRRGVERGEIRSDIDIELALDVLMGFVSYRHMISAGRPTYGRSGLEGVINLVLDGIATKAGAARSAHGRGSSAPARSSGAAEAQSRAESSSR